MEAKVFQTGQGVRLSVNAGVGLLSIQRASKNATFTTITLQNVY
jgi:hypothetical protein